MGSSGADIVGTFDLFAQAVGCEAMQWVDPERNALAQDALAALWRQAGGDARALDSIKLHGADPVLPSSYRIGTIAAVSIGLAALAAASLWEMRGGHRQKVALDLRSAAIAFRGERYLRIAGKPSPVLWDPLSGFYRAGDANWIQLHANFESHRQAALRVLGCNSEREQVVRAIGKRAATELETSIVEAGGCASHVRTLEEWLAHPQCHALDQMPLVRFRHIKDSTPEPLAPSDRPLEGLRVLDLTRVIAGPVCGRTLAEHGATVMRIDAPFLDDNPTLVMEGGRGKRSAIVDLNTAEGQKRFLGLLAEADILVQGYRPGAFAKLGLSTENLAARRPGLIQVNLSAYGMVGPWGQRRGFDSLVQSAAGIAINEARAFGQPEPRHLPAQALDHATGYLGAFGAIIALRHRAESGGSQTVDVSLARTSRWLEQIGGVDGMTCADPSLDDVQDLLRTETGPFGDVIHVRPAAWLEATPGGFSSPAVPIGLHEPVWPAGRSSA